MTWVKTHLKQGEINEAKPMVYIQALAPIREESRAQLFARKLFHLRSKGWGDEPAALDEVAERNQISPKTFKRIMTGEVEAKESVGSRIRNAYFKYCEELVARLQNEIAIEQEVHRNAAAFEDLGTQVEALARQVAEQKALLASARNRKRGE